MQFIDDNFVRSVELQENESHGITLNWSCIPNRNYNYKVEGFLICYMTGDFSDRCRNVLKTMGEDALLRKIHNSDWAYNTREDSGVRIMAVKQKDQPGGFSVLNDVFRAPCRIEIWTAATPPGGRELMILNRRNPGSICDRKLSVRVEKHVSEIPAVMGGWFRNRVIQPARAYTNITVSLVDADASYRDGAVGYVVPGCRYMYPIAKETLGKTLRLESFTDVRVVTHKEFGTMYRLDERNDILK